jgi:hypothetical protein
MRRATRRWLLIASFCAPVVQCVAAPSISFRLDGDDLHLSAPQFRFLTGKPMERLRDGASVSFICQLTLSLDRNKTVYRRTLERFVFSYDLWEEKFSVVRRSGARPGSNLSAVEAENWAVESLGISASGIGAQQPFWIRLEMRAEDPRDETAVLGEPGINLTRLIEVFSRQARSQQPFNVLETGPLQLLQIRKMQGRGSRGG